MRASKVLTAALLLVLAAVPAQALEPVASCEALQAWVAQLDQLPADYAAFTALPAGYQKAVYHQLSDAERAALWQHQLKEATLSGDLTADQQALVAETSRTLTEETFAAMRDKQGARYEAAKATVLALEARLAAGFSRQQYASLFAHLGDSKSGGKSGLLPLCDCALFSSGADCSGSCLPKRCSSTSDGCGDFGFDGCDGRCL